MITIPLLWNEQSNNLMNQINYFQLIVEILIPVIIVLGVYLVISHIVLIRRLKRGK